MSPHFERALRFAETTEKSGAWTLDEIHRLALELQQTHDLAIIAAEMKAEQRADESSGGSGDGGDGYRNLAEEIRKLRVDQ